jgi:TatD DNase family protein
MPGWPWPGWPVRLEAGPQVMALPGHAGALPSVVLVDTHCHLDARQFAPHAVAGALERARANGVARVVTVGIDVATSRDAVALAQEHEGVWAAVGVSPNDLDGFGPEALDQLEALAGSPRVVAVGEIGLDYHWLRSPAREQKEAFRQQLQLAAGLDLPVVVHDRDAHEDTLAILEEWSRARTDTTRPLGVLHCFSGDRAMARSAAGIGLLVSLAGNVTYPSAASLREVATAVEGNLLVLETDAPYLAPQGRRGTPNEPANVRAVAERVAAVRGQDLAQLALATTANASRLYRWAPWPS